MWENGRQKVVRTRESRQCHLTSWSQVENSSKQLGSPRGKSRPYVVFLMTKKDGHCIMKPCISCMLELTTNARLPFRQAIRDRYSVQARAQARRNEDGKYVIQTQSEKAAVRTDVLKARWGCAINISEYERSTPPPELNPPTSVIMQVSVLP